MKKSLSLFVFMFCSYCCTFAQISGIPTVCVGATTALSGTPSGGSWHSGNTSIALVSVVSGVVQGISAGVVDISYNDGSAISTISVTVNAIPSPGTITGASFVCEGASITLADAVPGGTWASSSANATVTSGVVSGITAGTSTISYIVTNSCGSAVATKTISINPLPAAGFILGTSSVCVGATITLTDAMPDGVWSTTNALATVSAGVVNGVLAGVDTIMYSVTNSCGTAVATKTVTIDPLTSAGVITGISDVCVGASVTLTDAVPGGTWGCSNGNAIVAGGVVTGVAPGLDTISYTVAGICGTATAYLVVTINSVPVAAVVSGLGEVCEGATITLTESITGGSWSVSNASASVSGGVVTGIAAGIDTVLYTISDVCGTAVTSITITINPLPDAGFITGPGGICISTASIFVDTVAGGVWASSDVSVATVSTSGLAGGIMAGSAVISYSVTNGCGTDVATLSISVDEPVVPITGPSVVCQFQLITLDDASAGGTWSSSNPLTAFVFGGSVLGILPGVATITYSLTNGCGTTTATKLVAVVSCGLGENSLTDVKDELQLSPNPNNGTFTFNLSSASSDLARVVVTNVVGEKVKELITTSNRATEVKLDVPAGVYFIKASTDTHKYMSKIIVQ